MFNDEEEDENAVGAVRYPCMPSLVSLQQMRNRLHLAYLGRKLMKWTALATGRELRRLAFELDKAYKSFGEDMRNAFMLLARGRYFYPNLNKMVLENAPNKSSVRVTSHTKTVSGVKVIQYEILESGQEPYEHLGIEKGGQKIHEAKIAWLDLLKRMILMLELKTSFILIETANKNATKKKNVLAKTVVPRVLASVGYILSELEEREREETFRLKRVKQKKMKKNAEGNTVKKEAICCCCLSMYEIEEEDAESTESLCPQCAEGIEATDSSDMTLLSNEIPQDATQANENEEKKRLEHLMTHIDEVMFDIVNHTEGSVTPSTEKFIETCNKFKGTVEHFANPPLQLSLCDFCKQNQQNHHKIGKRLSHTESGKSISFARVKPFTGNQERGELGCVETKTEEIIKIIKFRNEDGTLGEEKQVITIRTERQTPEPDGGTVKAAHVCPKKTEPKDLSPSTSSSDWKSPTKDARPIPSCPCGSAKASTVDMHKEKKKETSTAGNKGICDSFSESKGDAMKAKSSNYNCCQEKTESKDSIKSSESSTSSASSSDNLKSPPKDAWPIPSCPCGSAKASKADMRKEIKRTSTAERHKRKYDKRSAGPANGAVKEKALSHVCCHKNESEESIKSYISTSSSDNLRSPSKDAQPITTCPCGSANTSTENMHKEEKRTSTVGNKGTCCVSKISNGPKQGFTDAAWRDEESSTTDLEVLILAHRKPSLSPSCPSCKAKKSSRPGTGKSSITTIKIIRKPPVIVYPHYESSRSSRTSKSSDCLTCNYGSKSGSDSNVCKSCRSSGKNTSESTVCEKCTSGKDKQGTCSSCGREQKPPPKHSCPICIEKTKSSCPMCGKPKQKKPDKEPCPVCEEGSEESDPDLETGLGFEPGCPLCISGKVATPCPFCPPPEPPPPPVECKPDLGFTPGCPVCLAGKATGPCPTCPPPKTENKKESSESVCPSCSPDKSKSSLSKKSTCPKCGGEKEKKPTCPSCGVSKSPTSLHSKTSCPTCPKPKPTCPQCGGEKEKKPACPTCGGAKSQSSLASKPSCPTCSKPEPTCPQCGSKKEEKPSCPKCPKPEPTCPQCGGKKEEKPSCPKCSKPEPTCPQCGGKKEEKPTCPNCGEVKSQNSLQSSPSCPTCPPPKPSCPECGKPKAEEAKSDCPNCSAKSDKSLCKICSVKSEPSAPISGCPSCNASEPSSTAVTCPFCDATNTDTDSEPDDKKKGKKDKKDKKKEKEIKHSCKHCGQDKGKKSKGDKVDCPICSGVESKKSLANSTSKCSACPTCGKKSASSTSEPDQKVPCPKCGKNAKKAEEPVEDEKGKKKKGKEKEAKHACKYCGETKDKKGKEKEACPICKAAEVKKALDCNYCDDASGPPAKPSEGSCSICGKPEEKSGCKPCEEKAQKEKEGACPSCNKSKDKCKVCQEKDKETQVCPSCISASQSNATSKSSMEKAEQTSKAKSESNVSSPCPSCNQSGKKSKSQCAICSSNAELLKPKDDAASQSTCPSCGAVNTQTSKSVESTCPSCKTGADPKKQCKSCLQNVEQDKKTKEMKCPCGAEDEPTCPSCGAKIPTKVCPACGSKTEPKCSCQGDKQKENACICDKKTPDPQPSPSLCDHCKKENTNSNGSDVCGHCEDEAASSKSKSLYGGDKSLAKSESLCSHCKKQESKAKKCSCIPPRKPEASKCKHCAQQEKASKSKCCCSPQKMPKPALKKSASACHVCLHKPIPKNSNCTICKKQLQQQLSCSACQDKMDKLSSKSREQRVCSFDPSLNLSDDESSAADSNSDKCLKNFGIETEACCSLKSISSEEALTDDEDFCCSTQTQRSSSKSCCVGVARPPKPNVCFRDMRDASANTKAADRFDVRPVNMIPGATSRPICCCKSEPTKDCSCKFSPNCTPSKRNTSMRSSKSLNEKDLTYYGKYYI